GEQFPKLCPSIQPEALRSEPDGVGGVPAAVAADGDGSVTGDPDATARVLVRVGAGWAANLHAPPGALGALGQPQRLHELAGVREQVSDFSGVVPGHGVSTAACCAPLPLSLAPDSRFRNTSSV